MFGKWPRLVRWMTLVASGAIVLQTTGCDLFFQAAQTGLLAALAGGTFYLAKNV